MTSGLEYPARATSFVQVALSPGDTDVPVLTLPGSVLLYSILFSNGGSMNHVVSLKSGGDPDSSYFQTFLPKLGGTAFYNLVGTEFGVMDSSLLYASCDAGGSGYVYLTLGYRSV